jgi:glutamyl-tRNA reductase
VARALRQLSSGKEPEEVIGFLAHTLTNKLLHVPSERMRQAGRDGRSEILVAANELFRLSRSAESRS